MKRAFAGAVLGCGLAVAPAAFAREPWSSSGAHTVPAQRWEFGLFQSSHYGVTPRIELAMHPLLLFVLPHLEVKANALESGPWSLAVRSRWSYPTAFLALVSREGSGGLLPKTSEPPFAVQIEGDAIASLQVLPEHELSAWLGVAVAPHQRFTPEQLPLLDFPFLYPRFAALYSPVVPRAALHLEGAVLARLFYHASLSGYLMPALPDVGTAFAFETLLSLEYRPTRRVAVSLGLHASEAKYVIGARLHTLPFADVRFGF